LAYRETIIIGERYYPGKAAPEPGSTTQKHIKKKNPQNAQLDEKEKFKGGTPSKCS